MKKPKFILLALIGALILTLASCTDYEPVDIPNDMYAIMVPATGDTTQQGQLQVFEDQRGKLVSGKRILNPYEVVSLGVGVSQKRLKFNIYQVSRNPVSRTWASTTKYNADGTFAYVKNGDMDGVATETKGSAGIMLGFNITYYVSDPVTFLFRKKSNSDLIAFGDQTIRNSLVKFAGEEVAKFEDAELTINKVTLTKNIQTRMNDFYQKEYGITIAEIGMVGGVQFDNPLVQKNIDNAMIEKMAKNAVVDQLATFEAKRKLVTDELTWIDINMKKALIKYIESAADKGYTVFPSVTGSTAAIDVSKFLK